MISNQKSNPELRCLMLSVILIIINLNVGFIAPLEHNCLLGCLLAVTQTLPNSSARKTKTCIKLILKEGKKVI